MTLQFDFFTVYHYDIRRLVISKQKPSFAAILMYAIIAVAAISSAICLGIYYLNISCNAVLLWTGIVAFMIMYHLWVRIIFGNVTKLFKPDYNNLYRILSRVKLKI